MCLDLYLEMKLSLNFLLGGITLQAVALLLDDATMTRARCEQFQQIR